MGLLNFRLYTLKIAMHIDKWSSQNVVPVYLPANNVLKFPMIFFSSVYKFRRSTLALFLTAPVLSENSCSLLLFLLRELISSSCIAWLYQILPTLVPHPNPHPSPPIPPTFPLHLSGQGFFAIIFLSRELRSY